MSNDIFKPKDDCPDKLTKRQKDNITWAYQNAESLSDPEGNWTDDLAAVVETGNMIAWLLVEAFPFLVEVDKDE